MKLLNYKPAALKKEIAAYRKANVKTEAQINKLHKDSNATVKLKAHIDNQRLGRLYKSTRVPAKIGSIMVDYKLIEKMLKQLKDFETAIEVKDQTLVLTYWHLIDAPEGELVLEDISSYFAEFKHIPTLEVEGIES